MTYTYCRIVINSRTNDSKEKMLIKLDVFLLNDRITQEQYNGLVDLLKADIRCRIKKEHASISVFKALFSLQLEFY